MILKGSERGGAHNLAKHLLNSLDNDHIEVHSVDGSIADDVHGALQEMYAISRATKCSNFMFSLSLSPPQDTVVPVEDFEAAIGEIAERLGLSGQARVVLFHEKHGRRHCHAVFSRIDTKSMTAINMPFFKERLYEMSRELFLMHGWDMPEGLQDKSLSDPLNYSLEEYQVAIRAKRDPREIKATLTQCWERSDSRQAFEAALQDRGFWLAQGDRRGYVAIDWLGNVYSLSRWINQRRKALSAKLGAPDRLPTLDSQRDHMTGLLENKRQTLVAELDAGFRLQMQELEAKRRAVVIQQRSKRAELYQRQIARKASEARERSARIRKGLFGLWDWATGNRARIRAENEALHRVAETRDRAERLQHIQTCLCALRSLARKRRYLYQQHQIEVENILQIGSYQATHEEIEKRSIASQLRMLKSHSPGLTH